MKCLTFASLYPNMKLLCSSFQIVSCTGELACTGVVVSKEIKNEASNGGLGPNPGG
jgi:hypothetical protein